MKVNLIIGVILIFSFSTSAQRIVFDRNHLAIVNENGATRLAAENTHLGYLGSINRSLDDINLNISSVVLVQTIIHQSLTQVNQALKTGIGALQVGNLVSEIVAEGNNILTMARQNPATLLFAEDVARQLRTRGINLAAEVSSFILRDGRDVMMDFEKRDALMRKVILELRVMRALAYSMSRAIYWAGINGLLKSANPYRTYTNMDINKGREIAAGIRYLKQ